MTDTTQAAAIQAAVADGTSVPSAEYAEAMLSAQHGDPTPPGPKAAAERPAHIPEKFWDAEKGEARWDDLAKSYSELEKRQPKTEETPAAEGESEGEEQAPGTKIERKEDKPEGEAAPLTTAVEAFQAAFEEKNGEVTDEDIGALESVGLPRQTIDTYLAGLKAIATLNQQAAETAAGGAEAFSSARSWAAEKLSDADLDYYNKTVADPKTSTQAVEWLMAKYRAARPPEGKRIPGVPSAAASGDLFRSTAQVTEAMGDPRYQRDPAYRQQVAEKLLRSKRAGTITTGASYHSRGSR